MTNKDMFINYLNKRGIKCDDFQYTELLDLMLSTLAANEKFNLTAITDKDDFEDKMLIDSALGLFDLDLTDKKVIDIGTGAGFPGMVLYILNKKMNLTLLDSTKKKIEHLREYCEGKGFKNIEFVSERSEDYASKNRDIYDFAFARAVAPLRILIELAMPLLKVGGTLIAMKGKDFEKEIKQAESLIKRIGCRVTRIYEDELPISQEKRCLIYVTKIKETTKTYPRPYPKMKAELSGK